MRCSLASIPVLACLLLVAAPRLLLGDGPAKGEHRPVELLLIDGRDVARVQLVVELNGLPVSNVWDDFFHRLHAFLDQDASGQLDSRELALAPTPFTLRQALWGQFVPPGGIEVKIQDVDRNGDGFVDVEELAAYYRTYHLTGVTVAVGISPATGDLNRAFRERLDVNRDGRIDKAELQAAEAVLRQRDKNGDELLMPDEILPGIVYPAAAGTNLLVPPAADRPLGPHPSLLLLPASLNDGAWATALCKHLDSNGDGPLAPAEIRLPDSLSAKLDADRDQRLGADELLRWRQVPAAACWRATFQDSVPTELSCRDNVSDVWRLQVGGSSFTLRPQPGKLLADFESTAKQFRANFVEADRNQDGQVDATEISAKSSLALLQRIARVSDRNRDGNLSRDEMERWLDLQQRLARAHVLLTVIDYGPDLFELLDADHDGQLSLPELRAAPALLARCGCLSDNGAVRVDALPRQLVATLSVGHPTNGPRRPRPEQPRWFAQMDRNGDGCLSPQEFLGEPAQFDRLDRDHDGLISASEAERAASQPAAAADF